MEEGTGKKKIRRKDGDGKVRLGKHKADEVLKHYGYKPEEIHCNGIGIGVWRKEETFQKLGEIGAVVRFIDHKAKARIEFNYDPDFPAALLITNGTIL